MRAKRALGQNFLVDPHYPSRIAEAVEPAPGDVIVEIGPGRGALTRHLAGRVRRLIAIELDRELADELARELGSIEGVEVRHGNALDVDLARETDGADVVKVIGNIPYNITSPLIFWFLSQRPRPALAVFMVQREVADRMTSPPGTKAYGALSVGVRIAARVERLFNVPRGAFRPVPDVDSTVIRIVPFDPPRLTPEEEDDVRTLTRVAFGWRRKQLQTILRDSPEYALDPASLSRIAAEAGVDPTARPETLEPERFVELARALRRAGRPLDRTGPA